MSFLVPEVVRYASVKIVQIDSRKDVAGPSSGILAVGDVVRAARDLPDGAEAREALAVTRPGMMLHCLNDKAREEWC